NPSVSAMFYHPKKLMQVRMEGTVKILGGEQLEALWKNIPENSRKDYTTTEAPGSTLKNPDQVNYSHENYHFGVLHIIPKRIEYLQLKRPNHLRIQFEMQDGDWHGQFLVPL
ncbi:MAG: pyridoxamine 5'-phosphate oxidase, partial [Bacteroidota bacterium]